MYNRLLFLSLINSNHYGHNSEYENLDDEEKACIDYIDECLEDKSETFQNACTYIMLMLLDFASKAGSENEPSQDEIQEQKSKIYEGFTEEEKIKLDTFAYSCIKCIGIYSKEAKEQRKLRKERK